MRTIHNSAKKRAQVCVRVASGLVNREDVLSRLTTNLILTALLWCGALFVGWLTLRGWPSRLMPAAMFLWAVCAPLLAFGVIMQRVNPEHGLRVADVALGSAQAALLLAALASWSQPQTRAVAARWAPEAALSACLHDPAGEVVKLCCERLGPAATGHQAVLGRWLMDHERVPMACAVQSFDGKTPEANTVARILVERWEAQLLSASLQPEPERTDATTAEPAAYTAAQAVAHTPAAQASMCELASYMRHMDRVPGTHSGLRLLQCALRATDPEAQQCCAAQLHQLTAQTGDWANALGPPSVTLRTHLATRLLLLLPRLLNPPDAQATELLRTMRLDTASARRWSLGAACTLTYHDTPRVSAEAAAHLKLSLLMSGCEEVTSLKPRMIQQICSRWSDEAPLVAQPGADEAQMCVLARAEAVGAAALHGRIFFARARAQARGAARSEDPLTRALLSHKHLPRHSHRQDAHPYMLPSGYPQQGGGMDDATMRQIQGLIDEQQRGRGRGQTSTPSALQTLMGSGQP